MQKGKGFRINLTEEQKKAVREATGKNADAIELTAEELEDRIAPGKVPGPQDLA